MKRKQLLVVSAGALAVLFVINQIDGIDQFVAYARGQADRTISSSPYALDLPMAAATHSQHLERSRDELRMKLETEADRLRVDPVNAKVDRVWKAIPGYNGLELDIEKTLELAEQMSYPAEPKLVFREVPAAIQLEQLGAHPIYKGNPRKPMVSFMINVAWGDEYLPGMLETLKKYDVKATFFFDGSWLNKNKETALAIKEAGHELSNHAYSHKMMSTLDRTHAALEIERTEKLLKELGVENKLFAPPSGDYSQTTVEIAHGMGLRTVLWTLDTVDWQKPSPESVVRKIDSRVEPGSLILMHPTHASSAAMEGMIKAIQSKGLQLGTVSETLSPHRVPKVESEG